MTTNPNPNPTKVEHESETRQVLKSLHDVVKSDGKRADAIAKVEDRSAAALITKSLTFATSFDSLARLLGGVSDSKVISHLVAATDDKLPSQPTISRYLAVGRYVVGGTENATWERYRDAAWTDVHDVVHRNPATFADFSTWVRIALASAEQESRTHERRVIVDDVHMTRDEYVKRTTVKSAADKASEDKSAAIASEVGEIAADRTSDAATYDGQPDVRAAARIAFVGCDPDVVQAAADAYDVGELSDDDLTSLALAALATLKLRSMVTTS